MNQALWLLVGLQARAWLRNLGRNLGTWRGALLALLAVGVLSLWGLSVMLLPRESTTHPDAVRRWGPILLVVYCLVTVIFSQGERALYFSPAEVNFLFTGPFTRRQLLTYKLTLALLVALPSTLFLAGVTYQNYRWFLAGYLGLFLAFAFMQLFVLALNMTVLTLGERLYGRARKVLLAGVALGLAWLILGAGGVSGLGELGRLLEQSAVWRVISLPLQWFAEVYVAEPGDWGRLAGYGALGLGFNLLLLVLIYALDAQYLEAAAATSERIYAQLQRLNRGEAVTVSLRPAAETAGWSLPDLPRWGGIGPIFWRQLLTAGRNLGRLALLLLILGPVLAGPMMAGNVPRGSDGSLGSFGVLGVILWLSILMTTLVPFDFRSDLERMEALKTLPIPAWRIAVGQMLTPIVLLTLTQVVALAGVQIVWGRMDSYLLAGIFLTLPFNGLVIGIDNLLFLWFPARINTGNPGDLQSIGRNVLFLMVKMLLLAVVMGLATGAGMLGWFISGKNFAVGVAAAWLVVAASALALLPLLAIAFNRFDSSQFSVVSSQQP